MIVGSALLVIGILIFWYLTISREQYELRWYVQAHDHVVKAWKRLPLGPSIRLLAKFNTGWMKRMLRKSSHDVEMAPMGPHTAAAPFSNEPAT